MQGAHGSLKGLKRAVSPSQLQQILTSSVPSAKQVVAAQEIRRIRAEVAVSAVGMVQLAGQGVRGPRVGGVAQQACSFCLGLRHGHVNESAANAIWAGATLGEGAADLQKETDTQHPKMLAGNSSGKQRLQLSN